MRKPKPKIYPLPPTQALPPLPQESKAKPGPIPHQMGNYKDPLTRHHYTWSGIPGNYFHLEQVQPADMASTLDPTQQNPAQQDPALTQALPYDPQYPQVGRVKLSPQAAFEVYRALHAFIHTPQTAQALALAITLAIQQEPEPGKDRKPQL